MHRQFQRTDWLTQIPGALRNLLFCAFDEIERNYRERRWEPAELNGGKLCEVVYTVLRGHIDGAYPNAPLKSHNFAQSCRDFENASKTQFTQAVRISIPRVLIALYEIRNNRGVGHIGGDVDPNEMDATAVLQMSKWVMAELIRHFHGMEPSEAQQVVEMLTTRICPLIWQVGGKKRVLNVDLPMKQKVLALLFSCAASVADDELYSWTEHSNRTVFNRNVLIPLHRAKLIEYDRASGLVHLSPTGVKIVEKVIAEWREEMPQAWMSAIAAEN